MCFYGWLWTSAYLLASVCNWLMISLFIILNILRWPYISRGKSQRAPPWMLQQSKIRFWFQLLFWCFCSFWSSGYAMFKVNNENTRLISAQNWLFKVTTKALIHFTQCFISIPWGFITFSGGIEMEHWCNMD